jgi:hypothetical protein
MTHAREVASAAASSGRRPPTGTRRERSHGAGPTLTSTFVSIGRRLVIGRFLALTIRCPQIVPMSCQIGASRAIGSQVVRWEK